MQSLLNDCRRLLGEPPRRFNILDWGYLHFERPAFARNADPSVLEADDNMAGYVRAELDQELLRRHGRVVWAWLVHANSNLFRPGPGDHGGAVVYCESPAFAAEPWRLATIARQLKQPGERPHDAGLREIGAILDNEHRSLQDRAVPPVLAGADEVRCADLFIHRRHLPDGVLLRAWFPALVATEHTPVTTVLPARFWPADLVAYWATGDPPCLRPAVREAMAAHPELQR